MKVVLFCGGQGTRIRDNAEGVPKPMVSLGYRPVLWHVMKYYAHFGHKDFILCLGYRADAIKDYFLHYNECVSNDFVLSEGGKHLHLLKSDIDDWRVTFVDTGLHVNIGQRLLAVRKYLKDEPVFLANYADGLTDVSLPVMLDYFHLQGKTACLMSVKPTYSFHVVSSNADSTVSSIQSGASAGMWMNGGYFIFRQEIFSYIRDGEELVEEPFQRLIEKRELLAYKYEGFWEALDTFKDKQRLEDLWAHGNAPWEVWRSSERRERADTASAMGALGD